MILEFDDSCWTDSCATWRQSLAELLVLLKRHDQHSVLAAHDKLLPWCVDNLPLFAEYYKIRLAAAQPRMHSLVITISPAGAWTPNGDPPWHLTANAGAGIVSHPLRVVLENDNSDRNFLCSAIKAFKVWCDREWIEVLMGGGSTMTKKIDDAGCSTIERWRTFFLFDSDRLHPAELAPGWKPPGGDGCQGHRFEERCQSMPPRRWHRLERRSIENYLPETVLTVLEPATTARLFNPIIGAMANYYNMKEGLAGDGVFPVNPAQAVRAGRSQGFWSALLEDDKKALRDGFGRNVAKEFSGVSPNYSWPPAVALEMGALADAIQDAM